MWRGGLRMRLGHREVQVQLPKGIVLHLMLRGELQMEKRKLGSAGPEVPVICLGGDVYGLTVAEAEAFRQLDAALDAGLNFIDTADVYSRWAPGPKGGEPTPLPGEWLA